MSSSASSPHLMLRGSLITLKRKCGKPTCHCVKGKLQRSPALSYSLRKHRDHCLAPTDVAEVKEALRRYTQALTVSAPAGPSRHSGTVHPEGQRRAGP